MAIPTRTPGLLSQYVGAEIVVVDPATQQAHALSGALAQVWAVTETGRWPRDMDASAAADTQGDAVAQLTAAGLLQPNRGVSRRVMLSRVGGVAVVGGLATIGLPSVEAAASPMCTPVTASAFRSGGYTLTVPPRAGGTMVNFTLTGGGGGAALGPLVAGVFRGPVLGGGGGTVMGTFTAPAGGATYNVFIGQKGGNGRGFVLGDGAAGAGGAHHPQPG